jgi:cytoskeletal protein CcmA (bactofilin family)
MFTKPDKFQDVQRTPSRDDELRGQFPRSQPHPARSFESTPALRMGKTVAIKGEITATEDVLILGHVEGNIVVQDHTLTIGEGAVIEAEIKAHSVVVEGQVTGNVEAGEQLEIGSDGVVIGNVRTPSLVIRDGATLKGSVDMDANRPRPVPRPEPPPVQEEPEEKSSPFKRPQGAEGPAVAK